MNMLKRLVGALSGEARTRPPAPAPAPVADSVSPPQPWRGCPAVHSTQYNASPHDPDWDCVSYDADEFWGGGQWQAHIHTPAGVVIVAGIRGGMTARRFAEAYIGRGGITRIDLCRGQWIYGTWTVRAKPQDAAPYTLPPGPALALEAR